MDLPPFQIEASVTPRVSFASQQNSIRVLRELSIINQSDLAFDDLELIVASSPVFFRTSIWRISQIASGQRYRIPNLDLELDPGTLSRMNEAEKGFVQFKLKKGNEELAGLDLPVELLARNEWGGIGYFPELAAAFVQPNDPAVQHVLSKAIDVLKKHGKDPLLAGYTKGKEKAWDQLVAVWNAVCSYKIGYVLPPASFEERGQKVRSPAQVVEARIGTCLDLTMFFTSCLEQCGLHPLVIFVQGHAFVGCWLTEETFSHTVVDDIAVLRKRVHLQEILVFESTLATQQKEAAPSFKWSCKRAEDHIAEDKEGSFHLVVDVRRARMHRIRPLALAEEVKSHGLT